MGFREFGESSVANASAKWDLFVASAVFLYLELALIRWFPVYVLFLTFFTKTARLALVPWSCPRLSGCAPSSKLSRAHAASAGDCSDGQELEWSRYAPALQDVIDVGGSKSAPQLVFFGTEARVADVASFAYPHRVGCRSLLRADRRDYGGAGTISWPPHCRHS